MAVVLNGANIMQSASGLPGGADLTVTCWVRIDVDDNTFRSPWSFGDTGNYVTAITGEDGTEMRIQAALNSHGSTSLFQFPVGTWMFLAVVKNGTTWDIYYSPLSGVGSAMTHTTLAAPATVDWSDDSLYIGGLEIFGDVYRIDATLAAFKVWDEALGEAELESERLYVSPQRTTGLNRFYAFAPGAVLEDSGPSGFDLTVAAGSTPTTDTDPVDFAPAGTETALAVDDGADWYADFHLDAGNLVADGGIAGALTVGAFSPAEHRWLRIRIDAGTTTSWETSPDGRRWFQKALANSYFPAGPIRVRLTGVDGDQFDNLNAAPQVTVAVTGALVPAVLNRTVGVGTVTFTAGGQAAVGVAARPVGVPTPGLSAAAQPAPTVVGRTAVVPGPTVALYGRPAAAGRPAVVPTPGLAWSGAAAPAVASVAAVVSASGLVKSAAPAPVGRPAVVPTATLAWSGAASPTAAAGTAVVGGPTVSLSYTAVPAAVGRQAAVPAVSPVATGRPAPDVVTVAAAVPGVGVGGATAAGPVTVGRPTGIPAATPTATAVAAAAVAVAPVVVATPTVTVSGTVSPAVAGRPVAVGGPTVLIEAPATVPSAPVAAAVVVPTPGVTRSGQAAAGAVGRPVVVPAPTVEASDAAPTTIAPNTVARNTQVGFVLVRISETVGPPVVARPAGVVGGLRLASSVPVAPVAVAAGVGAVAVIGTHVIVDAVRKGVAVTVPTPSISVPTRTAVQVVVVATRVGPAVGIISVRPGSVAVAVAVPAPSLQAASLIGALTAGRLWVAFTAGRVATQLAAAGRAAVAFTHQE